jgi:hypothetical protein
MLAGIQAAEQRQLHAGDLGCGKHDRQGHEQTMIESSGGREAGLDASLSQSRSDGACQWRITRAWILNLVRLTGESAVEHLEKSTRHLIVA